MDLGVITLGRNEQRRGEKGKNKEWVSILLDNSVKIFKASALLADAFHKLICQSVCPSVCLFVCLFVCSLLRYRLNVFLTPLHKVRCPKFLEIENPLGKEKGKKSCHI